MMKSRILVAHVFAVAVMSGIASALATHVALADYGIELAGVWRSLFAMNHAQLRSAVAWWTVAGAAFVGGFVVAFAMSRFDWLYLRFLRVWLLALVVLGLGVLAHDLPRAHGIAASAYAFSSAAALLVAFLMASFGAYFALRR
jgi:hypothetical protein